MYRRQWLKRVASWRSETGAISGWHRVVWRNNWQRIAENGEIARKWRGSVSMAKIGAENQWRKASYQYEQCGESMLAA